MNIQSIKAYTDNYIWLIETNEGNLVIDPGDSAPVEEFLENNNLSLTNILLTHHHFDHTGGVKNLKDSLSGKIYGPHSEYIEDIDILVKHGDMVNTLGLQFEVLEIPGHTLDHIAYFLNAPDQPALFCGDTLFSAGCGRVFEGTYPQMYESLMKLKSLPAKTLVYCAHEYTLSNLMFAKEVEPDNQDIKNHIFTCRQKLDSQKPSLPSTLETELLVNPFLRCDQKELRQAVSGHFEVTSDTPDEVIFEQLRVWKDTF